MGVRVNNCDPNFTVPHHTPITEESINQRDSFGMKTNPHL
jgi:hypothetical protein